MEIDNLQKQVGTLEEERNKEKQLNQIHADDINQLKKRIKQLETTNDQLNQNI